MTCCEDSRHPARFSGGPTFQIISREGVKWVASATLGQLPWLVHAFGTRTGDAAGGLNLAFTASDSRSRIEENRRRLLRALGGEFTLAALRQVHSARVARVTRCSDGTIEYSFSDVGESTREPMSPGDALMTGEAGILISIRTADCLPILLVDPRERVVGAVHVGWRGALARIVEKAVEEMTAAFQSRPRDLLAALGPSIRAGCYEVGEEVRDAYRKEFGEADHFFLRSPSLRLDLVAAASAQLHNAGVAAANMNIADLCTACRHDLFFSHRKDGAETGRMMSVIGLVSRGRARSPLPPANSTGRRRP